MSSNHIRILPPLKNPREKNETLGVDDRVVIIQGWTLGWSDYRIARAAGCHRLTIWKFKQKILDDPGLAFYLPLMSMLSKKEWGCRLCGEVRSGKVRCQRHVLRHFLPIEIARDANLNSAPERL